MQIRTGMLVLSLTAIVAGCSGEDSAARSTSTEGQVSGTFDPIIFPDPQQLEDPKEEAKLPNGEEKHDANKVVTDREDNCKPFSPIRRDGGEDSPFIVDCSSTRIVRSLSSEGDWKFYFDQASTKLDARFGETRTEGNLIKGNIAFDRSVADYEKNLMPSSDLANPLSRADFDDASWEKVTLPHTWNRYGRYCRDDLSIPIKVFGHKVASVPLRRVPKCNEEVHSPEKRDQGQGWYRLKFDNENNNEDSNSFLEFDGVSNVSDVWLNDTYLGRHNGAFSRFRFDVTGKLKAKDNILVVRADNTQRIKSDHYKDGYWDKSSRYVDNPTSYVLPLSGDFTINGGIYRNVNLIQTKAKAHFEIDTTYGGPGVFISASPQIAISGPHEAVIGLLANVENPENSNLKLRVRLSDMEGQQARVVSVANSGFGVDPGTRGVISTEPLNGKSITVKFRIADAKLWQGIENPYLYRVTVELLNADNVERVATGAFKLNGKIKPVYGVSRHQDWLEQGWALSKDDHDTDMKLIREMGSNAVRFAHYQHDPRWFNLADSFGMLVWAEIPYIDGACVYGGRVDERVKYNARQQMQELIRQNYNSPSVVWWGISNETARASEGVCNKPDTELNKELRKLTAAVDDSLNVLRDQVGTRRPNVIASNASPNLLQDVSDEIAYNTYPGWYDDQSPKTWPKAFLRSRLQAKRGAVGISEYGSGGTHFQHRDRKYRADKDLSFGTFKILTLLDIAKPAWASNTHWHPIENQTLLHQQTWAAINSELCGIAGSDCNVWGSFIWNMYDFASYFRAEGGLTNINNKGLVSMDRKHKKDAFYFYKSAWNKDDKFIHLASRSYTDCTWEDGRDLDNLLRIEVFSNIGALPENLKLEITPKNGGPVPQASVDRGRCELMKVRVLSAADVYKDTTLNNVCVWKSPMLSKGTYSVKVSATVDGKEYSDKAEWTFLD